MAANDSTTTGGAQIPALRFQRFQDGRTYGYAIFNGERRNFGRADTGEALAKTRLEFDRVLAQWLRNGRSFPKAADAVTVADVCTGYTAHQNRKHGDGWCKKTGRGGRVFYALETLRGVCGAELAAAFDLPRLEDVRSAMIATGKLCRGEVNARISAIRSAFKWAGRQKLVPRSVWAELADLEAVAEGEFGTHEGKDRKDAPVDAVLATLPHLPPPFDVVVELQLRTGARPSEILNLRRGDIDQSDPAFWVARLAKHKTAAKGKERRLVFDTAAQRALRPFLDRAADAPLFSPAEGDAEQRRRKREARETPLWPSHELRYAREAAEREPRTFRATYESKVLAKAVARAIARANEERATKDLPAVPNWTPYEVRHTVGTEAHVVAGSEATAGQLGHASTKTTARYSHAENEKAKKAAKATASRPSLALLDEVVRALPGRAPRLAAV
jgi:integrase